MQRVQYHEILAKYIPEQAVELIVDWLIKLNFDLKITKERLTKLGDYRPPFGECKHLITINHNLNPYNFLITLVHEIAHLTNWEKHKNHVKPHGKEWKNDYKILMNQFIKLDMFPEDVLNSLKSYMDNPAAATCSDPQLLRVLRNYDPERDYHHLEELPENAVFKTANNRYFIKGEKLRTRFKCRELKSKRVYLFNPMAEVLLVNVKG